MKLVRWILLILTLSLVSSAEEGGEVVQPSLERLEVMIHREQFAQALQPLKSVESSARDARWEGLVEKAAIGELQTLLREAPVGVDTTAIQLLIDFPKLSKSAEFLKLKREAIRANGEACLDSALDGFDCAQKVFQKINGGAETILFYAQIAELFSYRVNVAAAIPFLQLAQKKGLEEGAQKMRGRCHLPLESQKLLFKALSLPDGEVKQMAIQLASGPCASEMKPMIQQAKKNNDPHLRRAVCEIAAEDDKVRSLCTSADHR